MTNSMEQAVYKWLGIAGRMISGSKTGYCEQYPKNIAIFNCNVIVKSKSGFQKVWWGDLDITNDKDKLASLSQDLNTDVYVLPEKFAHPDYRNEERPDMSQAIVKITPQNEVEFIGRYKDRVVLTKENKFILS